MCVFITVRMRGHGSEWNGLLCAHAPVHARGGEDKPVGRCVCTWGCGCGEDPLQVFLPGYKVPKGQTITNLRAHFSLCQPAHSSQGAASGGQDLRFLSLRPLERHSNGEQRAQTPQIKSHWHLEGPRQEGVQNPRGRYKGWELCNPHPLERERRASSSPTPHSQFEFFKSVL